MTGNLNAETIFNGVFAVFLILIGVLNLALVHPVPGLLYFLLAFFYLPPANKLLRKRFRFSIPFLVKLMLAVFIILFTFGVSDLGDMIDKW